MPLDLSIYRGVTPQVQQPDSPLDVMQKVATLRDSQALAQDRSAMVQQRQQVLQQKALEDARDRQENDQIQAIVQKHGPQDLEGALQEAYPINPKKVSDYQKSLADSSKTSVEIQNLKIDHDLKILGYTSRQLAGVSDQHSYDVARAGIKATTGNDLPPNYDPATVQAWQEKGMTYAEKLNQMREERMVAHQQQQEDTAAQRASEQSARDAETARHNLATERHGQADDRPLRGSVQMVAPVAPNATIEDLAKGSGYSPDGLRKAARAYHESGNLPALGMGSGKAKQAIQNAEALLYGAEGDLAMSGADFKAKAAALGSMTKQLAAVKAYEGTGLANLKMFTDLAKNIPDTGVPWLNTPLRSLSANVAGSENMAAINAARQVALTEISKVVNNPNLTGSLSDSAREEVLGLIPENATFGQILHVAKVLQKDMAQRPSNIQKQIANLRYEMSHPGETAPEDTPQQTGGFSVKAPNGKTYKFTTQEKAAAFKKAAGIQ